MASALLRKDKNLKKTISHTTRDRRPGERNGRDYHFVDRTRFKEMARKRKFLEWATTYNTQYGTSLETVETILKQGKDAVLVIESQGAQQIRRREPNSVFILLLPPSLKELKRRLTGRAGSAKDNLPLRLRQARKEIRAMGWYDYLVLNQKVSEAVASIETIVKAERQRLNRQQPTYRTLLRK